MALVFSDEFKQDAVRLVTDEKYTFKAAAEALGVGEQRLRQCVFPPPRSFPPNPPSEAELPLKVFL